MKISVRRATALFVMCAMLLAPGGMAAYGADTSGTGSGNTVSRFDAFKLQGDQTTDRAASSITSTITTGIAKAAHVITKCTKLRCNGKVLNLRTAIGESSNGYAVAQGGCTDGKYIYQLMVSSSTQKGRVLKLRLRDRKTIAKSKILNICHGNGMTYDSKRKRLVIIGREDRRQELTFVDAKTLKVKYRKCVKYSYFTDPEASMSDAAKIAGVGAIAYNRKHDCYLVLQRWMHNIIVFDASSLEAIGYIKTTLGKRFPGTFQAMDADDQYVYMLLSYYDETQPYNLILAIDWNSEKLQPVTDGKARFIGIPWKCGRYHNGRARAAIRVGTPREAENIYHTTSASGKEHFYLTEYDAAPVIRNGKIYRKRNSYIYDIGVIQID